MSPIQLSGNGRWALTAVPGSVDKYCSGCYGGRNSNKTDQDVI